MKLLDDETRRELRALYAEVDALLGGHSCELSKDCCHFGVTGKEPQPTPAELALVFEALRARGITLATPKPPRGRRHLPLADSRRCPILGQDDRCRIYEARPFGCRTFFCDRRTGPGKMPRKEIAAVGRRIADLSARAFPRDPHPRPLVRALSLGEGPLRLTVER